MIVSVIMPLFNAQAYLPDALDCVIKQTYEEFELICINDCSSDDTEKILRRFQEKDSRIRILTNERRLGAGLSRNKGIEASKGKHIIFLDGDDIFDEQLLEKHVLPWKSIMQISPCLKPRIMYPVKKYI